MLLPNSTRTEYSHDAAGQLTGITHSLEGVGTPEQGPSSTAFATRGYDYNTIGLRTNMLSGIAGVGAVLDEYTHDPLDQLVRARYDAGSGTPMRDVQYSFDGVGNRLSVDDNGAVTPYVVNDLNQYTSVAGIGLTYDANGNLAAGPGFTLTYDAHPPSPRLRRARNRLIQATAATGSVTFAYDGRNRCVKRTTLTLEGGSSVWLVWGHAQSGQWGLLEERDSSGDLAARYVHGERIDEILRREGPEGTVFYHHDALGSTIALTDGSGALVEQYRFDMFGLPTIVDASGSDLGSRTSALGNRFLFTGREWLSDLALYDYRHRVYSPALGRWLQPDAIGFAAGDVNLYGYCGNTPTGYCDPAGQAAQIAAALAIGLGVTVGLAIVYDYTFKPMMESESIGPRDAERLRAAVARQTSLEGHHPKWDALRDALDGPVPPDVRSSKLPQRELGRYFHANDRHIYVSNEVVDGGTDAELALVVMAEFQHSTRGGRLCEEAAAQEFDDILRRMRDTTQRMREMRHGGSQRSWWKFW